LLELGILGLGTDIDVGEGFALFFRMSLGALASGLFFGIGTLLVLAPLKRRLSQEENMVETVTTITMAYLCYFTTDVVWGCSGVIGALSYGLVLNALGWNLINDRRLVSHFWSLVEHMLNTVLFTLGGLVWGGTIGNGGDEPSSRRFTAKDWGYLFALYVLLLVIRFGLFAGFYPVTRSIGLKTSCRETVFQSYAGLRGAIGISLALYIDNLILETGDQDAAVETNRLFGMVGGVAFLTLVVNATCAGPLLHILGLSDTSPIRKKILTATKYSSRDYMIDNMVSLLSQHRFRNVTYAVIKQHIPLISDLTKDELARAVRRFYQNMEQQGHTRKFVRSPSVHHNILPYLSPKQEKDSVDIRDGEDDDVAAIDEIFQRLEERAAKAEKVSEASGGDPSPVRHRSQAWTKEMFDESSPLTTKEVRRLFLELLRASYTHQVEDGSLSNHDYLKYALDQSIEFAREAVSNGKPLKDWEYTTIVRSRLSHATRRIRACTRQLRCYGPVRGASADQLTDKVEQMKFDIERCMAFLEAHRRSRDLLRNEFVASDSDMSSGEKRVLEESEAECLQAEDVLFSYPAAAVEVIVSHQFCIILLNQAAKHAERLSEAGLLLEEEATEILEEIQDKLLDIDSCRSLDHGELEQHQLHPQRRQEEEKEE